MLILRKVPKSLMECVFYCPGSLRKLRQAPLSCDLDLGSISAALQGNYRNLFHSESVASHWGLIFPIFRRSCPRNTRQTTRRDVTVCKTRALPINNNFLFFSDATVDVDMAMPSPCAASSHAMWRTC